ncbi:MAG: hypothetical protein LBS31_05840 [Candidatus Adiutrix sp.]|jgi:hypothetical protein|nr:hypothetical protein [Candidatus Adiutrix sp.]
MMELPLEMTAGPRAGHRVARFMRAAALILICGLGLAACDPYTIGYGHADPPEPVELPSNPIEKAAINGLLASYRESAMWEIQKARALQSTPVAPTAAVLREHDPKELYCVCVEYEARYRVPWATADFSPWERTVRNILIMKTQADAFLAVKPMNVCAPFCE